MINLKELEHLISNNSQENLDEYFTNSFSKIDPLTKKLNGATKWMTIILVLYFFFIEGIINKITAIGVVVEDWIIIRPFFLPAFCSVLFYYMVVTINREELRYLSKLIFNNKFNTPNNNRNWLAANNIIELQRFYFPFSFRYELDKLKGRKSFGWTDLLYGIPYLIFQWIIFAFLKNEVAFTFDNIGKYWFSKYLFVLSLFLLFACLWVFTIMIIKSVKTSLATENYNNNLTLSTDQIHMKNINEKIAWILILIGILVIVIFTFAGNYIHINGSLQPSMMSHYGTFIGGTAGILFTLAGYFLIFSTLKASKKQQFESTFHNRLSMFQEFRTKQIALKEILPGDVKNEKIHYGTMFFDFIFTKQINLQNGEKRSLDAYVNTLKIHRAQFEYYFGFFEMCLSAMFESNLNQKEISTYADLLHNLLSEQEKMIFSMIDHIVVQNQFPKCSIFSKRFDDIFNAAVLPQQ